MPKTTHVAGALLLGLLAQACGPSPLVLNVRNALDDVRDRWAEEAPKPPPTKPAIRVTLKVPPHLACVYAPEQDPGAASGLGKQVCKSYPVATGDADAAEEQLAQQMKRSGVASAILLRETAGTTRAILQRRLSEHFRSVQVDVQPAAGARGVQFRFYEGFGAHPKTSIVRMTATRAGGGPTVAEGRGTDRIWSGHLAWMIPACAATGLLPCVVWLPYAGKAIHDGARERALAYGIDQAASQLAARLARQADGAPGDTPSYEIQVSAAPAASPP